MSQTMSMVGFLSKTSSTMISSVIVGSFFIVSVFVCFLFKDKGRGIMGAVDAIGLHQWSRNSEMPIKDVSLY